MSVLSALAGATAGGTVAQYRELYLYCDGSYVTNGDSMS